VSFGSRTRVVNLTGLQSTATLSHLLDGTLTPIEPTSSGIILSRKLAAVLGAEIGDIVDVELIGLNLQAKAPVVRLAEQYIGLDAYMDFNALNHFIDDGARITGVHLQIDTSQRTALHRALKAMPAMAGVTDPAVVLASFQNTMARTLTLIVSFFVGFAGLAALGIVYSNARIILSEREPELAILTALGFSAGEVAYVFVGELTVLVLSALPIGCILGRGLGWLIAQNLDTELYRVPLVISPETVVVAIVVVLLAAVVSTWIVGRKLQRLDVLSVVNLRQ
jgi:putative ABC transport system permease protein